jgi:hypothetical protein
MDPSTKDVLLLLQTGLRIHMVKDGVANPSQSLALKVASELKVGQRVNPYS